MASPIQASAFELVFGGSFKNFKPEVKTASQITELGDNILYLKENGRYGIKIAGTAHEFAHVADLADFATEAWVNSTIETAVISIQDGVATDGDTLAKLRALITALDAAKADKTSVATLADSVQGNTDEIQSIKTLLNSDDINLDTLQEVVNYIKSNNTLLSNLQVSNIAGLQAALDSKVSQLDYDARVAAVNDMIASKVSQAQYDARVTAVNNMTSYLDDEIDKLRTSAMAVVDQIKEQVNAVQFGSEYAFTASVPPSKKIVGVNIELDGKAYMGYERVSETEVKVVTPQSIGTSKFRIQLHYLPN